MFNQFRKFILFLMGLSVPMQGFAVDVIPGLPATPFKMITAVLFVLAGLQFALRLGGRPPDRKNLWVVAFVLSYVISIVVSLVAGLPPGGVLKNAATMTSLIAFYALLSYTVQSRDDLVLLLWALVLGGVVTVLPAAWGGLQIDQSGDDTTERFAGLAGQENLLGADMNVCFAIAVGLFFMNRSQLRKAFLLGAAALAVIGVALSLSRAAFVALGLMWLWWLYRSGRRGGIKYAAAAVLVGIIAMAFVPGSVVRRAETMFDPAKRAADRSIQGRILINEWAVRAFLSNPVTGVGAWRFAQWVHEQPDPRARRAPWHTVHNAYLGIAAEQGLMGLAPFLALLLLSWRDYSRCWRAVRARHSIRDPVLQELGAVALFLQLALLSGIVTGLFHQQHRSKTLWMVMALSPVVVALVRARLERLFGAQQVDASAGSLHAEPVGALPRPHPG